jgi:hypothetical protein
VSTILKALRRIERERQPQPGKPLRDDVVALQSAEPQERPDRTLWWAGRVGPVLILVLGGLWLASGMREPGHETEEPTAPAAVARPDARALASEAVVPAPTRATRADEEPAPVPEILPSRRSSAPQRAVSGETTSPPKPAPAAVERPRRVAVRAPERSDAVTERPQRLPDPEPLHAFEAPTARAATPEAAPRPEREVSVAKPKALPAPEAHVDSTTWHPDPARRLAVVSSPGGEPLSLREGDAIGELVVLRIEPAAVLFLYRGRELSRRVGE